VLACGHHPPRNEARPIVTTLFRPLSTFKDVPPASFDGLDKYDPGAPPPGAWPAAAGGPSRSGRSATPLVHDHWSLLWEAPLGDAARPSSLLVGRDRVVVNGADQRGVWTEDGRAVGVVPQTGGTALLDLTGDRLLFDSNGGVATYTLDAKREASVFLSFSDPGTTKEILRGPGVFAFLSVEAPPHSSPHAEVLALRVRDYTKIKNGILYGLEPLAGITRSEDRDVHAAAGRTGPVIATDAGVLWCDWQLRPLHESLMSGAPDALSVDDQERAVVIVTESFQTRLRIIRPGGQPIVDLALPASEYRYSGPPIISSTGQIYLTPPRALLAISPDGKILWEQTRPSTARGSVSANGLVLVAGETLDAVTAEGRHLTLWRPPAPIASTSRLPRSSTRSDRQRPERRDQPALSTGSTTARRRRPAGRPARPVATDGRRKPARSGSRSAPCRRRPSAARPRSIL
jgi:hypothetical protein